MVEVVGFDGMGVEDLDLQVVSLDDEVGSEIAEVLASESTNAVYSAIEEEPRTPSELSDALEMSLQNVHYHLEKLVGADLVESIDIEYSARGREMQVYGAIHDGVVLCNREESKAELEEVISRFIQGTWIAILGSTLVHLIYRRYFRDPWDTQMTLFSKSPGGSGDVATSVPWWKYPSVWVFVGVMALTILYCVSRYYGVSLQANRL